MPGRVHFPSEQHEDVPATENNYVDVSATAPPDATTSIVEVPPNEFPSYFSERNERLFHSSSSPYPLPVDTPETERLTMLHNLLRQLLGENFVGPVPAILAPPEGSERPRMVLDVCTGNGKWVIDMAHDFPRVLFRGFDIVPIATRYPPENVQFELTDVNAPLRWANGTFDVVHSRFVDMAVIDYHKFAREIARVMRPGGLFVSYEWSPYPAFDPSMPRNPAEHAPASTRFHEAINTALAMRGLSLLGSRVPTVLANLPSSFTDITPRVYCVPIGTWPANPPMRSAGRTCRTALERYTSSIRPLLVEGGWSDEDVDDLVADYLSEINNVRGLVSVLYTVHARRV
ncbi:S-adenosyl-L-methionine-dependent methyltransferase [Pholiota conissans]|uniref:S-adenosyl-L-methionine-dependent methyltransferase n=1 Tax=Pholiota conissans TaxID=109636 RepID=A0A9P6CT31_9AGAR|nr:S-adenosyl-L-methionine-dependent methyltransferase [Pholiota conissans]